MIKRVLFLTGLLFASWLHFCGNCKPFTRKVAQPHQSQHFQQEHIQ